MAVKNSKNILLRIIRKHINQAYYQILFLKLHVGNNYENTRNIFSKSLLTILIAILAVILIPLGFLINYIFVIYKLIVIGIVQIYLRSKFDGYPSGFDISFTIGHNTSKQIINFIIAIADNEDVSKDLYLRLKKQIQERVENKNISRLQCIVKRYFGYIFYEKDSFNVNDYWRQFDVTDRDIATRKELELAFDRIINNPLPKNNHATWEALLSKQPVYWMKNNDRKHHIIIFRLYHAIGDAACGNKIIHALFADFSQKIKVIPSVKITNPSNNSQSDEESTRNLFKDHLKHKRRMQKIPANLLFNPKMSFHQHGAWVIEENKKYVDMIKNIKNARKNLTFNTVVIASISLSLSKFCQKRGELMPETMPLLYAINTKPEELGAYDATDLEAISYENTLSWAQIKLPIICDKSRDFTKNSDVLYLLSIIEKEVEMFKQSHDLQVQTWFSKNIFNFLTIPLMEFMIQWQNPVIDFSNLPGSRGYRILGNNVTDVIFFTPDMTKFSIGFSCTTYSGRLQLGAIVDDATFSSKDAQEILDGLPEALEHLNRATKNFDN